ncbi:MAG: sensor histidine kinase [Odoribacter splanchnicus]
MRQKNIPEEIRDDLEVVKRNSERLLDLVNQILDFTKAEQEAFSSQNTWFDIDDLVEKTVQRFTPAAQQKGIQLTHDTPQPIRICTDREALTKVLSNLLTNAMKFTKDRILVSLTENPEAHTVTISVEDNGTGIKPTEKEKIFNLFYQSANKPQLPNKGFGIGLAIVSLLVKRMMGKIEVESEENRFTRFRITLPQDEQNDLSISVTSPDKTAALREVKTEDPIEPAGTEKTDKDGKKAGTVLIVEDNEEFISYSPVSSDNDIISTRPEMEKKH